MKEKSFLGKFSIGTVAMFACVLAPFDYARAADPAAVAEVMLQALDEREALPIAPGSLWRFEGPKGHGNSGRMNELVVDPSNPQIIYATGATGGAWKTTDGGQTWAPRSKDWPIQSATAVALDPRSPNRVYVGTGDYKRLDHVEPFSIGIMRSLDGGLTWRNFGSNEMREFTVSRIVVDPTNSNHILAATGRGSRLPGGQVFRSTNGGTNWTSVGLPDGNWDDLEVTADHVFWASATRRRNLDSTAGALTGLLYRSVDGSTWEQVRPQTTNGFDLDNPAIRPQVIHIACPPGSSVVYVGVFETATTRLFVTGDSGTNWAELNPAVTNQVTACGSTNPAPIYPIRTCSGPWAHSAMAATANFIYVGGVELWRGGFVEGVGILYTQVAQNIHADFQCITPDPTERDAVFCAAMGVCFGTPRHRR